MVKTERENQFLIKMILQDFPLFPTRSFPGVDWESTEMFDQWYLISEGSRLTMGGVCVSAGTGEQFQFPSSFPVTPVTASNFSCITPASVSIRGVRSIWYSTETIPNFSG
jgi:hypothetical protein